MQKFKATIEIIGINPFVDVPGKVLREIFEQAGKDRGHIPIRGTINENAYTQTLVKYKGAWRLYINTKMLKDSPLRVGEIVTVTVEFDPADRSIKPHPKLVKALKGNPEARVKFATLKPSRKLEIVRYISFLKKEESIDRNVARVIRFLLGEQRFAGRDKP